MFLKIFTFFLLGFLGSVECANVGLLVMATGKYIRFIPPLVESAETHFCRNHKVTYFVFTDQEPIPLPNTVYIFQSRLGWPLDTMARYHVYEKNWDLFKDQDFLFASDADMLFVAEVGDEILGERVATLHPGFVGKRERDLPYEANPNSKACVKTHERKSYFAGGFYGGAREAFHHILQTNIAHIDDDLSKEIVAVWHDESHWNRYCLDYPPTVILNPSYCYPESWSLPYPRKLLALDKNHAEVRK
jgi:histo-blood group ABO system transferase